MLCKDDSLRSPAQYYTITRRETITVSSVTALLGLSEDLCGLLPSFGAAGSATLPDAVTSVTFWNIPHLSHPLIHNLSSQLVIPLPNIVFKHNCSTIQ